MIPDTAANGIASWTFLRGWPLSSVVGLLSKRIEMILTTEQRISSADLPDARKTIELGSGIELWMVVVTAALVTDTRIGT
jgi:hypothetical protein